MSQWRILCGDVREWLRQLPPGLAQCVVTSPPYWGLRDYGMEGQLGLESSPEAYCAAIVDVFRELRRVLTDDGVCWLNLGDSYVSVGSGTQGGDGEMSDRTVVKARAQVKDNKAVHDTILRPPSVGGLPCKNLIGIPWRVALALQASGWYLRSEVIWHKPNPMPESVTDRPTKAHENLFLLTKSAKYYYNADAIAEPYAESTQQQVRDGYNGEALKDYESAGVQNPSDTKRRIIEGARLKALKRFDRGELGAPSQLNSQISEDGDRYMCGRTRAQFNIDNGIPLMRNRRTVWTIPTKPYEGAHFATFPEALVEPCILAGSKEGDLVLDPFCGSGTTGAVAIRLQRNFLGIELNPAYVELARTRIGNVAPLLAQEMA